MTPSLILFNPIGLVKDWLTYVYGKSAGFLDTFLTNLDRELVFWTFLAIGLGCGGFFVFTIIVGEISEAFGDLFGGHGDADFGGHDGDVGADHDAGHADGAHSVGTDHNFDSAGLSTPSFFSVRFALAFLSGFGMGGAIATRIGYSVIVSSLSGIAVGLIMSAVGYGFARALASQQASFNITDSDLMGREGFVSVGIPGEGVGQIILQVGESSLEKLAQSADGVGLPEQTRVIITRIVGQRAMVKKA